MTSIPASMKALARTLAPRSCPSRPGFATRTLIFSSMVSSLERRVRPIFAEHGAQHVADFTKSRVCVDRVDDRWHQVCISACDRVDRIGYPRLVPDDLLCPEGNTYRIL